MAERIATRMKHRESVNTHIRRSMLSAAFVIVVAGTSQVNAQTPLSQVIPTMLGPGMAIAPGPGGTHAQEFVVPVDDLSQGLPRGFEFTSSIVTQITTFPIGSSSGGFLYGFDPVLGTFTRATRSFGPSYTERPETSGRGTVSVGFTFQNVEYDHFDGTSLNGNDVKFHYVNRNLASSCGFTPSSCTPTSPELSDVMEATLRLGIRSRTVLTSVTYGVTDRLDVGVTVPWVTTTLEARVDKRILRLGTAANPSIHSFDGLGADTATSTGGGSASGLGDLRFQAKYNVVRKPRWALSGLWDVRLATGDSSNLLGNGTYYTRVLGLVSAGNRIVSAHANGGMSFAGGNNQDTGAFVGEPRDEVDYAFGIDWSAAPRATISVDVLARTDAYGSYSRLGPANRTFNYVTTAGGPVGTATVTEFSQVGSGSAPELKAVIGGKVGPWRTMLLSANVLFPLNDIGLTNKPALSLGVEYTF